MIATTFRPHHHYLYSGDLYCDHHSTEIQTILGSCVSVCLHDWRLNIGGMNHFLMPTWNGDGIPSPKFGDTAIKMLIARLTDLGANHKNMAAKIFGGAWQLEKMIAYNIGKQNTEIAFKILADYQIPVIASHVGGSLGRKITFRSDTGQVFLKLIKPELFKPTNLNSLNNS
jgi:chemotaxis protein CheD